ncbi:Topoisomerase 1-associated factor 1 [Orbilia oligospora]|uniref:Topoisomerase 1-associated factor 1 n=1 Tax=Orbilia oligospora TaxID=2813651 RepID=A0A7C8PD95_ORBOL|nr:Topoisomerase 1-associated factor 1 [Orbilia oligospora]KAF3160933.1 Topoisomerase 1-associated factor 1 [Orbilia oligospora]KAF3235730.1 Topoisomerase 1-associated factor 1 [Orbilia oligospora]KAF3239126.1 Topoisomerase 1-associated factor 1 [Orbilia oligospora]KAF3275515.1 Topoisomerase 1-associated factor 1 [Orbilia oligospora]
MDITGQPSQKGNADGVDPILRSHIYGLVSALGGPSPDDPNTYILGDDVFGCLRDIKRWLKGYDEKLDRLDVARCLSEANLVVDLMEILSHTSTKGISTLNHPNKIGLACVELLVPLTWPLNKTELSMTVNHHRHLAVLRRSQAYYKKNILTHQSGCILKACCVNALPPMTVALSERTPRDEGIIRLVLYLIRNLLQIQELELENDNIWNEISKSSTIESFDGQGIFDLLLSIISGVPELFQQQDVIVVEILFHLLLGVDMRQFVVSAPEAGVMKTLDPLAHILKTETPSAGLKAQSRHTRFGTTVVLKNEDGQNKVVTGHSALLAESTGLRKLDDAKKWRKPQQNVNKKHTIFGGQAYLDLSARGKLCRFLGQILISGFSSLFQNVRKAIERDSKRILGNTHIAQLFFVGGSLMEFGRGMKQDAAMLGDPRTLRSREFSTLLQPETFIILFRHIREGLESKSWDYVQSGCHYFTQALLVVSDMMRSQDHDEKSFAENIFNRLFYEETLHDLMIAALRSGRKQTVEYLDILTQMIHVYLRCLERYCKSNSGLIVKSKRASKPQSSEIGAFSDSESDTKMPDRKQAEKSFNFQQYESKFLSPASLEPFLDLLSHYKELGWPQIKRCIGFLHRVFVKRGATVGLFHLKAIYILQAVARDTKGSQGYTEVAGFVRFFSKHLVRKLSEYPVLFVEILFQKSQRIGYFIEHGEDRSRCNRELPPLLTIELEEGLDKEKRIAVAVWLVSQDDVCCKQFGWVERVLYCVVEERRGWETKDPSVHPNQDPGDLRKLCPIAVKFEGDSHTQLHFSSNKLQLLMKVLDFEPEGSHPQEFCYVLPDTVSFQTLQESITTFLRYMKSPISEFGDGKALADCFTMKRKKFELKSSDSNGEWKKDSASEAFEPEFPDNLKARKSRSTKGPGVRLAKKMNMDENEAHRRHEERKLKERERRRGIKSGLYIGSSDDDSDYERDQEFFEKERVLREAMSKATLHADGNGQPDVPLARQKRSILDETARDSKRLKTKLNSDGSESGNDGGNDSSNDIGRDSGSESSNDSSGSE